MYLGRHSRCPALPCSGAAELRQTCRHRVAHLTLVQREWERGRELTVVVVKCRRVDVVVKVCREAVEVDKMEETRVGKEHKWFWRVAARAGLDDICQAQPNARLPSLGPNETWGLTSKLLRGRPMPGTWATTARPGDRQAFRCPYRAQIGESQGLAIWDLNYRTASPVDARRCRGLSSLLAAGSSISIHLAPLGKEIYNYTFSWRSPTESLQRAVIDVVATDVIAIIPEFDSSEISMM
jgi:hypothetical protein